MVNPASTFPAVDDTFNVQEPKKDKASHKIINHMQNAILALEANIGNDVHGTRTDLLERLSIMMATNGAIANGASFPGSPVDGQFFYRTDQNVAHIYNGATWDSLGESLSNVIFSWAGVGASTATANGLYTGATQGPDINVDNVGYGFVAVRGTSFITVLDFQYTHISGIANVTINARLWAESAGATQECICNVDIGGQAQTVSSVTSNVPAWYQAGSDIDVSGLTPGTTYDGIIQLKDENSSQTGYCSGIVLVGS